MTANSNQADPNQNPEVLDFVIDMAKLAEDLRCENVIALDLRGRSPVTDYYIIATGTSDRQMRAVADEMARIGKQSGNPPWHVAGMDSASWILLDFVDVVIHLFTDELRGHYDLEILWGDAPRLEWERNAPADEDEY